MADKDTVITKEWQSIYSLVDEPVGTELICRFKGNLKSNRVYFVEGDKPDKKSLKGDWLDPLHPEVIILQGSDNYWFRTRDVHVQIHVRST